MRGENASEREAHKLMKRMRTRASAPIGAVGQSGAAPSSAPVRVHRGRRCQGSAPSLTRGQSPGRGAPAAAPPPRRAGLSERMAAGCQAGGTVDQAPAWSLPRRSSRFAAHQGSQEFAPSNQGSSFDRLIPRRSQRCAARSSAPPRRSRRSEGARRSRRSRCQSRGSPRRRSRASSSSSRSRAARRSGARLAGGRRSHRRRRSPRCCLVEAHARERPAGAMGAPQLDGAIVWEVCKT